MVFAFLFASSTESTAGNGPRTYVCVCARGLPMRTGRSRHFPSPRRLRNDFTVKPGAAVIYAYTCKHIHTVRSTRRAVPCGPTCSDEFVSDRLSDRKQTDTRKVAV